MEKNFKKICSGINADVKGIGSVDSFQAAGVKGGIMGKSRRNKDGKEGDSGKTCNMPCLRQQEKARRAASVRALPSVPPGGSELPIHLSSGETDIPHVEKAPAAT